MLKKILITMGLVSIGLIQNANAVSVTYGRPVEAIGSLVGSVPNYPSTEGDSYYDPTNGQINFYIPLNDSICGSSTSCVFGVTDVQPGAGVTTAGTTSDKGDGGWLRMFLLFQPAETPAATATLLLTFTDLDLAGGGADTSDFFESVKFYDKNGNAITNTIDNLNDDNNGSIPFTVTGSATTQQIYFSNIASLISNPFYLDLRFRSNYTGYGKVWNTPEQFSAKLTVTGASVPEPTSMLLLGSALAGLGIRRRKS